MEGVPRIPMLGFPLKRSADTPDLRSKIKKHIHHNFHEDPETYSQEISTLENLRSAAVHATKDITGCATLKKYFCQLLFLKSRFPFYEGQLSSTFSWYDVYTDTVHGWKEIDFEISCVLFNIGALHSQLGTYDARITADGMKNSCTHFQCAAWAFQHLKNDYIKFLSPDLSTDVLTIMMNICLAQAQECILEKSLIDNRKFAITAKIALQIVEYYQTTQRLLESLIKKPHGSDKTVKAMKKWKELVDTKYHYYSSISYMYRGLHAEEQSKYGERITYFKASAEKLAEASKCAKAFSEKGEHGAILDTLNFTNDVVSTKLTSAEKENEFVYHEKVPDLAAVDIDFKGVSLVKGIPFRFDDPEVAGSDIFSRLIPMAAHEASSMYSEEKAKLLRTYSAKVEEKNAHLDKFLLALNLEQLDMHSQEAPIPQALIDCCAALSTNPDAVKTLTGLMSKLSGMFHDVEHNLQEITSMLKVEESKEKEYQDLAGKRPPNNHITEISRELKKYQQAHSVASESNQTLHEAMRIHIVNLQILMKPFNEVLKQIPSMCDIEEKDEASIQEMKRLRGKIEEMRIQRETLFSNLRESILGDDITKSLVVKKDQDRESVFAEELKKHEKLTQILDQNLLAQENIIRAVTEANASYASTRKATEDIVRKRNSIIHNLVASYDAYNELLVKCTQGVEFYTKLESNVSKLLQRAKSACKILEEERDERMNAILKKTPTPRSRPVANASSVEEPKPQSFHAGFAQNVETSSGGTMQDPNDPPHEKNWALQQQYQKNLALQQEYEQLTKLQQMLAKDGGGHAAQPPNLNYPPAATNAPAPAASHGGNASVRPVSSQSVQLPTSPVARHIQQFPAPHQQRPGTFLHHPSIQQVATPTPPAANISMPFNPGYTPNAPNPIYHGAPNAHYIHPGTSLPSNVSMPNSSMVPQAAHYGQQGPSHNPSMSNSAVPQAGHYGQPNTALASNASVPNPPLPPPGAYGHSGIPASSNTNAPMVNHGMPSTSGSNQAYAARFIPTQLNSSTLTTNVNNSVSTPLPSQQPPTSMGYSAAPGSANPLLEQYAQQYDMYRSSSGGDHSFPLLQQYSKSYGMGSNADNVNSYGMNLATAVNPHTASNLSSAEYNNYRDPNVTAGSSVYSAQMNQMPPHSTIPGLQNPASGAAAHVNASTHHSVATNQATGVYPYSSQNSHTPYTNAPYYQNGVSQAQQYQNPTPYLNTTNHGQAGPGNVNVSAYPFVSAQSTYNADGGNPVFSHGQQPVPSNGTLGYLQSNSAPTGPVQAVPAASSGYTSASVGMVSTPQMDRIPANAVSYASHQVHGHPLSQNNHPKMTSNIDLLSEVDLSLSHAPLQPSSSSSDAANVAPSQHSKVNDETQNNRSDPETAADGMKSKFSTQNFESDNLELSVPTIKLVPKKPLSDPLVDIQMLEKFTKEVENLEHIVENFSKKSLNGPTNLDTKWKEVIDVQNAASIHMSISVARCYPMKNRYPDILPHDQTRVPLPCTKDDYINASFVQNISSSAIPFIATQAPLPVTYSDFWHMIWQQKVELILCLVPDIDLKAHIYWPLERGKDIEFGSLSISLQSRNSKAHHVERIFRVTHRDQKSAHVAIHLQFNGWPGTVFPENPGPLLSFLVDVHGYYQQQRSLSRPVVAHCVAGVGKTGVFTVLSAAIRDIQCGLSFPDLTSIAGLASEQRKGIMNDKEYLRFAYKSFLYYCQDLLMKRGILSSRPCFADKPKSHAHIRHPSEDFLAEAVKKIVGVSADRNVTETDSPVPVTPVLPRPNHVQLNTKNLPKLRNQTFSDVPFALTDLDASTFQKPAPGVPEAELKRAEFLSRKGALTKNSEDGTIVNSDPLSSLDPLWTIKK